MQNLLDLSIFILDAEFKIVWINQAIERFFGLRREEVVGKDKRQVIRERIKDIFTNALPIAGKDGTMAYRLQSERKGGRILAKTGSMTGVASLAGYVKSKNNGILSFVIIINGFVKPRRPYIALEDQVCRFLVKGKKVHG